MRGTRTLTTSYVPVRVTISRQQCREDQGDKASGPQRAWFASLTSRGAPSRQGVACTLVAPGRVTVARLWPPMGRRMWHMSRCGRVSIFSRPELTGSDACVARWTVAGSGIFAQSSPCHGVVSRCRVTVPFPRPFLPGDSSNIGFLNPNPRTPAPTLALTLAPPLHPGCFQAAGSIFVCRGLARLRGIGRHLRHHSVAR